MHGPSSPGQGHMDARTAQVLPEDGADVLPLTGPPFDHVFKQHVTGPDAFRAMALFQHFGCGAVTREAVTQRPSGYSASAD